LDLVFQDWRLAFSRIGLGFPGLAFGFLQDWIGFFEGFSGFQWYWIPDGFGGSMVVKRVRVVDNTKIVKL
jgi:hypothetical protein